MQLADHEREILRSALEIIRRAKEEARQVTAEPYGGGPASPDNFSQGRVVVDHRMGQPLVWLPIVEWWSLEIAEKELEKLCVTSPNST
ncbi:MAG: hypothetical protein HY376_01660 [Candidatus Blackburnbacteria bacterium]|nr:hypothetical protein [Candidatus Blackburnbacteria bacterium]